MLNYKWNKLLLLFDTLIILTKLVKCRKYMKLLLFFNNIFTYIILHYKVTC